MKNGSPSNPRSFLPGLLLVSFLGWIVLISLFFLASDSSDKKRTISSLPH
jgi:hypothetical protein